MTQKTALIAGASGQIGGYLLPMLLESDAYSKVIVVGRNTVDVSHPKLEQRITDMFEPGALAIACEDVFCCLGTTIKKAGTQQQFRRVDHDLVVKLANETLQAGAKAFYVVSSAGASADSRIFYVKVKGDMEQDVAAAGFASVGIFKPSMLLGPRKERRVGEQIGKFVMQLFAPIIPKKWKGVHARKVADAMLKTALAEKQGIRYISNTEILEM